MMITEDDGQRLLDNFFETYESKGHDEALTFAFSTVKWIDMQGDEVRHMRSTLGKLVDVVGNYIGYEQINSKMIGSRFRAASCFAYYDRQPIRFIFLLYRNNEGWMIWNIKFDTNYDDEVEKAIDISDKE